MNRKTTKRDWQFAYSDDKATMRKVEAHARQMNGIGPRTRLPHGALIDAMRDLVRKGLEAAQ